MQGGPTARIIGKAIGQLVRLQVKDQILTYVSQPSNASDMF